MVDKIFSIANNFAICISLTLKLLNISELNLNH